MNPYSRRADPVDLRTEALQQFDHDTDILDLRHVRQLARLVRQNAGGQQWQRRVLVTFDVDAAA